MSGSQQKEQARVVAHAASKGFTTDLPNSNGYIKIKCPCGKHKKWIHKTPSNPRYWNQAIRWIDNCCQASGSNAD